MELSERVKTFLDELGVPATVLCRKINLSTKSLHEWRRGKMNLSESTLRRIDEYLRKYGF